MDIDFNGKAVFITGAASGIGQACAQAFAESGASVVVADITDEGKAAVGKLPTKDGSQHIFVKTDVTSQESIEAAVKQAEERLGKIDVLINNAGISYPMLLVDPDDPKGKYEMDAASFDKMTAVNQKGAYLVAQAVGRGMVGRKAGVIVNMASESGLEGSEGQSCYAATKAALYSFTRSWAKELGRHGIRVVGVAPGTLEQTRFRGKEYEEALAYTRGKTVEEVRKGYEGDSVPLKRVGKLREVAELVLFLASDKASYMTGTTVNMSGGKSRA